MGCAVLAVAWLFLGGLLIAGQATAFGWVEWLLTVIGVIWIIAGASDTTPTSETLPRSVTQWFEE